MKMKLTYVDVPTVTETFVDGVHGVSIHEGVMRMELCVTRVDEPHPPEPLSGKQFTAMRIAMPVVTAVQLHGQLTQILSVMEKQGVIHLKQSPQTPPTTQPH